MDFSLDLEALAKELGAAKTARTRKAKDATVKKPKEARSLTGKISYVNTVSCSCGANFNYVWWSVAEYTTVSGRVFRDRVPAGFEWPNVPVRFEPSEKASYTKQCSCCTEEL